MARRIAISNIAWEVAEDEAVARVLGEAGVDAIDIAPGKYFPDPGTATDADMARVRRWWSDRGLAIHGMQALLFGTAGLNLFGDAESQRAMLARLDAVCRIGAGLDARYLVFGSPKNRDRSGLSDEEADALARDFFRRLGDLAGARGVFICLEPNPPAYGCNFMTGTAEAARVVQLVDHPAIRMQLDTGAITMNGEDVDALLPQCAALIGHVHASEPHLVPIGEGGTDHARVAAALARWLPDKPVSIEMVAAKDRPHPDVVRASVAAVQRFYAGAGADR